MDTMIWTILGKLAVGLVLGLVVLGMTNDMNKDELQFSFGAFVWISTTILFFTLPW